MTKLSLALAAAILIGCGSEGAKAADKAPLEVQADSRRGFILATSLEDGLKIYNAKVNRGNCSVYWDSEDAEHDFTFKVDKNLNQVKVRQIKNSMSEIETLTTKDFYDKYGTDKALKLNFGEKEYFMIGRCDPIEFQVDTDKGSWTFSFR